jgi:2-oxoglutarate ferredoxin oxidoreductase subunit beta
VGREVTRHVPKLAELIRSGLEHPGFAFIEVLSDCTEIFGRKNEMGSSPRMLRRPASCASAYRTRRVAFLSERPADGNPVH